MKNLKIIPAIVLLSAITLSACEKKTIVTTPLSGEVVNAPSKAGNNNTAAVPQQELPPKVKAFLDQHYPDVKISKYEMKEDMAGKKYEVKLDNGVEVEFDTNEMWKEIKDYNGVPQALVPAKVASYVNANYKDIKIKSIEIKKDKNRMDVDLLNGTDLEFDMNGTFLRIDK